MPRDITIIDDDNRFVIDGETRQLTNVSGTKPSLMQFDHNSELLTFAMSRYIEGHDMSTCDRVEIHFTNTGGGTSVSKRAVTSDIVEIKDLAIDPEDENSMIFSWLIGQHATQHAGTIVFQVKFVCYKDENTNTPAFIWHTNKYSFIDVLPGLNITDSIIDEHPNVIDEIHESINTLRDEKLDSSEAAETYATIEAVDVLVDDLKETKLDSSEASATFATHAQLRAANDMLYDLSTRKLDKTALATYFSIGSTEPAVGPALWFDTSGYKPAVPEQYIALLDLGDDIENASVTTDIDGEDYSIKNLSEPEANETGDTYYITHAN